MISNENTKKCNAAQDAETPWGFRYLPSNHASCFFAVSGSSSTPTSPSFTAYRSRVLNQQIKRNRERFPSDFVFHLTAKEHEILRSQIVISRDTHGGRRYSPYAFTEHGAIMAATVLNSERAVQMSVFVVRAFVRLREMLATNRRLAGKIDELENRLDTSRFRNCGSIHDHQRIDDTQEKTQSADWVPASAGKHQRPESRPEGSTPELRRAGKTTLQFLLDPAEPSCCLHRHPKPAPRAPARLGRAVPQAGSNQLWWSGGAHRVNGR